MKRYIIDHERYGVRSEFVSLEEAQDTIRACGGDFADTTLREHGENILDDRGDVVGEIAELDRQSCNHRLGDGHRTDADDDYTPGDECSECHCTLGTDGYWYVDRDQAPVQ